MSEPALPATVTPAQVKAALAFLGVPGHHLTEVTFTHDAVTVTGPLGTSYGQTIFWYADPAFKTWTRRIPLVDDGDPDQEEATAA